MRHLGAACVLVVLAACNDDGAHLTFSAPDGPASAASFQLVLATPDVVPKVQQRIEPAPGTSQRVPYYLQRTLAGIEPDTRRLDQVDGFTLRVAPGGMLDGTSFIPFVLLRDDAGKLVGIGTYHAGQSTEPSPILVKHGEIDMYTIEIEPVDQVDDMAAVAARQVMPVDCYRADQSTWPSGIAWRPASWQAGTGGEVRLLFPDTSDGSDRLDATGRMLDLDCDGHAVAEADASADCDDSRGWFYQGAVETCDGYDTNCDGSRYLPVACTPVGSTVCTTPNSQMGVALCDDTTGQQGTCASDPQCLCALDPSGCTHCVVSHEAVDVDGKITPCQPGEGTLTTPASCDNSGCTVEVVAVSGGWQAQVAAEPDGLPPAYARKATGVGNQFLLRVQRPEGPGASIPGQPGHVTGQVDLAIVDQAGTAHYLGVPLLLDQDNTSCPGNGPFAMVCSP